MSDKVKLRDEIKKEVRALLLSSPVGLSIRELARDFKEFIFGKDIPFRELGYNSLEDLLKDMPDAVVINWTNGQMILKGVADSSTQHIQDLVSKQKVSSKKKWDSLRRKPPPRTANMGRPPRRNMMPVEPFIPAWLREYIVQCLNSYPEGVFMNHFEDIFYRRFGTVLDYRRCGFKNLSNFFRYLSSDIVRIEETRLGPRLYSLRCYNNQRGPQRDKRYDTNTYSNSKYQQDYEPNRNQQSSTVLTNVNENEKWSRTSKNTPNIPRLPKCSAWDEVQQYKVPPPKTVSRSPSPDIWRTADSPEPPDEEESNFTFVDSVDSGVSEQLQSELRELTTLRPKGIWAARLPFEYKQKFGKQLSIKDSGYMSVIEFVSALPNVFKIERPNPKGDWLLFDVNSGEEIVQTSKREATRTEDKSVEELQKEQKEIIRTILEKYPDGILMGDFPKVYKEVTGKTLPLEKIGCIHLESLLLSLTDTILQLEYKGDGKMMIYPMKKLEEEMEQQEIMEMPPKDDHKLFSIPEDAVGFGSSFTQVPVKQSRDYIEIYVSNVVDPGVFWIQLRGKNTTLKLEELMDSIDFYNKSDGDRYIMPDSMIVVGQVCAVIYPEDRNWHRGVICSLKDGDFVEVYYVDYGNTCTVHKTNLRFLKMCFLSLPAQAVQSRLANIKYVGNKWTTESTRKFMSLCTNKPEPTNKPLVAMVTSIESYVMSLCLIDTTIPGLDIHINDELVNKGHAVLAPDQDSIMLRSHPEVPDYGVVYGNSAIQKQVTGASATAINQTAQVTDNQVPKERFIIQIQLTDEHKIHLINYDRQPWVIQTEISALFNGENVRSMVGIRRIIGQHLDEKTLQKSKLNIKKIVISREDHLDLFKELAEYNLTPLTDDGRPKPFITFYDLNGIPELLKYYNHPNEHLHEQVAELILSYSPDDPYWTGEEDLDDYDFDEVSDDSHPSPKTVLEMEKSLNIEDLEVNLQSLQFRRKRILQSMMSETIGRTDIVNELNEVEMKIMKTKEILDRSLKRIDSSISFSPKDKQLPQVKPTEFSGDLLAKMTLGNSQTVTETKTPSKVQVGKVAPSPKTNVVLPMVVNPSPSSSISTTTTTGTTNTSSSMNSQLNFTPQQLLLQQMQLQQQQQMMLGMMPNLMMPQLAANLLAQGQTMDSGFSQLPRNFVQSNNMLPGMQNIPRMPGSALPPGFSTGAQQQVPSSVENPLLRTGVETQNAPRMPGQFQMMGQQAPSQNIPGNFHQSSNQNSNSLNMPNLPGGLLNNPIRFQSFGRGGNLFPSQNLTGEMPIIPGLNSLLENYRSNLGQTSDTPKNKTPGDTNGVNQQ